ncbi:MAG: V-type ATP synthase subunit E [Spirochaetales bacterium]|nr:MAG: V-type ATP synthase subunit E [Spirochaetales bacterium]
MDVQLKELLEKIKEEGVKPAEEQSSALLLDAEKKAAQIVKDAQKKAEEILAQAKADIQKEERTGREALKQAGRDLLLALKNKITGLFDSVINMEVEKGLTGGKLEDIIVTLVKAWAETKSADITVLLSKTDLEKLEKSLKSRLAAEMKKGVEIKPSAGVDAGFLISEKDGAAYYNFSVQGIGELLGEYLNVKLAGIIKEAAAGGL